MLLSSDFTLLCKPRPQGLEGSTRAQLTQGMLMTALGPVPRLSVPAASRLGPVPGAATPASAVGCLLPPSRGRGGAGVGDKVTRALGLVGVMTMCPLQKGDTYQAQY